MTASSVRIHGRHVSKRTSSGESKPSRRRRTAAEAVDDVAKKPDADELRRLRAAYYKDSSSSRRMASAAELAEPRPGDTALPASRSRSSSDPQSYKPRRKHKGSFGSRERRSGDSARQMDGEYVYQRGASSSVDRNTVDREERSHTRSSIKRSAGSSARNRLRTIAELEVTPEDGVSQVDTRRSLGPSQQLPDADPPVRKSGGATATSRRKISDAGEKSTRTKGVSNRPSQRDSRGLGSLLRRSSTIPASSASALVECLTCGSDDIPRAHSAKLSCGHRMCHDCLKRIFQMSVKDPAHMPPKCCRDEHIPLKHVDKLFDLKFKMLWNRKYQEYNTKNRVYCPVAKCGIWIKPSHMHTSRGRKYAQCPKCKTKVCPTCNSKLHQSQDCPKDPEMIRLAQQAKDEGWQKCYSCNALVELKEGCNHMTCRCTAEFCMVCGAKWKTCDCPWFNYAQLPNLDQLNDMMIPQPIQVLYRRLLGAVAAEREPIGDGPAAAEEPNRARRNPAPQAEERDRRRRQERLDADLAQRLQLATLMDPNDDEDAEEAHEHRRERRRGVGDDIWGVGNGAGHFMNDDYVQNAANVVMRAFADPAIGRRGERTSGRRRRARHDQQAQDDAALEPGFIAGNGALDEQPSI